MDTDARELLEDASELEEEGEEGDLVDGEEAAANLLEEGQQVLAKAGEEVIKFGKFALEKVKVEQIEINAFEKKVVLPGGGMFVQQKDGTQTIYTGRTFNQRGDTAQMEHVTINPDGSVSVAGEGTTIRQKGDKTVISTADGARIITGPNGIESYRTAKGDAVDFVRVKKAEAPMVQEKQDPAALQAAADAKAIWRLSGAAQDANAGKLDAKTIDSLVNHFKGRNVDVIAKINNELQGMGGKFKVSCSEQVAANGDTKRVYRLTVRATGQTVATESVRR